MILVITARRMMVLETLLDVQLALLHTEIDRVNLLLHRTHTPCKDSKAAKSEHNLHHAMEAKEQSMKMMIYQASQHE
jgi:hypothetical protein